MPVPIAVSRASKYRRSLGINLKYMPRGPRKIDRAAINEHIKELAGPGPSNEEADGLERFRRTLTPG